MYAYPNLWTKGGAHVLLIPMLSYHARNKLHQGWERHFISTLGSVAAPSHSPASRGRCHWRPSPALAELLPLSKDYFAPTIVHHGFKKRKLKGSHCKLSSSALLGLGNPMPTKLWMLVRSHGHFSDRGASSTRSTQIFGLEGGQPSCSMIQRPFVSKVRNALLQGPDGEEGDASLGGAGNRLRDGLPLS